MHWIAVQFLDIVWIPVQYNRGLNLRDYYEEGCSVRFIVPYLKAAVFRFPVPCLKAAVFGFIVSCSKAPMFENNSGVYKI